MTFSAIALLPLFSTRPRRGLKRMRTFQQVRTGGSSDLQNRKSECMSVSVHICAYNSDSFYHWPSKLFLAGHEVPVKAKGRYKFPTIRAQAQSSSSKTRYTSQTTDIYNPSKQCMSLANDSARATYEVNL